jgi:hypothetical protein
MVRVTLINIQSSPTQKLVISIIKMNCGINDDILQLIQITHAHPNTQIKKSLNDSNQLANTIFFTPKNFSLFISV